MTDGRHPPARTKMAGRGRRRILSEANVPAPTGHAVAAGAHTGWEVAARLGWTRRGRALADLDVFN